VDVD
jgi:hypothetical protein